MDNDTLDLRKKFLTLPEGQVRKLNPYISLVDLTQVREHYVQKAPVIGEHDLLLFPSEHVEGVEVFHPDAYHRRKFRSRWGSLYPELDMPSHLWKNVVAAGGAVLRAIRAEAPNTSLDCHSADVDLFIWGLDQKQAEAKIRDIHDWLVQKRRLSDHPEPRILRTDRALTILSQWPQPHIQIILRLYRIPAEIPIGFDIDCCAAMFDGERVRVEERLIRSLVYGYNRADPTRLSPQYESRLRKYARRGLSVHVPLDRPIDMASTLKTTSPQGLAKLLQMEKREREKASPTPHYRARRFVRMYRWQLAQVAATLVVWCTLSTFYFYLTACVSAVGVVYKMEQLSRPPVHWKYHDGSSGGVKLTKWAPSWLSRCEKTKTPTTLLDDPYTACVRWIRRRLNKRPPTEHLFMSNLEGVMKGRDGTCKWCKCALDRMPPLAKDGKWYSGAPNWITINPGLQYMSGSLEPLDPAVWLSSVVFV